MSSDLSRSSFDISGRETSTDSKISYLQAFLNDRPKHSFDAIQHRLRGVKVLSQEIADYFKERIIIEDNYVKSLQRLTNKTFVTDRSYLCTFGSAWDTLFNELQEIISIHSLYITKVSKEVETHLREKIMDPAWLHLKQEEINMSKLIKEYEEKLTKLSKHKAKTEKLSGKKAETSESKVVEAQNAFDQKKAEWQTEWSKYLEKSQVVDFVRWINLKEAFVHFETLQAELYQKRTEMTERNLGKIMEFDAENEILDFCSRRIKAVAEGNSSDDLNLSIPANSHFRSAFGTVRRKRTPSYNAENAQSHKIENCSAHNGSKSPSNVSFTSQNEGSFVEVSVPKVLVDSEGYSIPPTSNDEADSDALSDGTGSLSVPQERTLRVEIKPTSTEVNEKDAAAAMLHVTNTLKSTPTIKNRAPRGRRDRNTIYNYSEGSNVDSPIASRGSPERPNSFTLLSPNVLEFPEVTNHPRAVSDSEIQSYGLRTSITETINMISKAGGEMKLFVTGEISISYNRPSVGENPIPIRIKINNFDTIEKSAPNTSYLHAVPESIGSYDIDTGLLSLAGDTSVAVMKYQLRIDPENKNAYIPLQITPHWKCEPNLLSLAIVYQANSECKLSGTLTDLSFIVPVGGEVGNVQSKPTGMWNTEKQMMYWRVDDIDLAASSEQNKLLARFATGQTSQPASAAVKFVCKGQLLSDISLEIIQTDSNVKDHFEFDNFKFQQVEYQVVSGKFLVSQ